MHKAFSHNISENQRKIFVNEKGAKHYFCIEVTKWMQLLQPNHFNHVEPFFSVFWYNLATSTSLNNSRSVMWRRGDRQPNATISKCVMQTYKYKYLYDVIPYVLRHTRHQHIMCVVDYIIAFISNTMCMRLNEIKVDLFCLLWSCSPLTVHAAV